jgi:hypothetical protein
MFSVPVILYDNEYFVKHWQCPFLIFWPCMLVLLSLGMNANEESSSKREVI